MGPRGNNLSEDCVTKHEISVPEATMRQIGVLRSVATQEDPPYPPFQRWEQRLCVFQRGATVVVHCCIFCSVPQMEGGMRDSGCTLNRQELLEVTPLRVVLHVRTICICDSC